MSSPIVTKEPAITSGVRLPRRFRLRRASDVSGVSGTGVVAYGVEFHDGQCVVKWATGVVNSLAVFPKLADVLAVHGHGGETRVEWLDAVEQLEPSGRRPLGSGDRRTGTGQLAAG